MDKRLIFDIGMHTGQDTISYLRQGFRVVTVEANPFLVEANQQKFKKYIDAGLLTILNVGISDKESILPFYINQATSEWSSFDFNLGTKNNTPYEIKNIQCIATSSLFEKYGIPYYMKVDIEGYDFYCVNDLPPVNGKNDVKYFSCEASDVSLIDTLHKKGYTKFKLIHQAFDFRPMNIELEKNPLFAKFVEIYAGIRNKLGKIIVRKYPYSSSGPIPENTKGEWLTYETARQLFLEFFTSNNSAPVNSASWFDFHATY